MVDRSTIYFGTIPCRLQRYREKESKEPAGKKKENNRLFLNGDVVSEQAGCVLKPVYRW